MKDIETYTKDNGEILNFSVYPSRYGPGDDQVLQHKNAGGESAHVTLHPKGEPNYTVKRSRRYLDEAIRNNMRHYSPSPSQRLLKFIDVVKKS